MLLDRSANGEVLVDVNGVGYRASVGPGTLAGLGQLGDEVFLYVHTHVREDALTLYGFAARDELACFEALLGAHGVGPALALAILATHPPSALRRVLVDDDVDALTLVPGVGKKTAARLLIDLKARLQVPDLDVVGASGDHTASPRAEVRAALGGLGYDADEVRDVLAELPDEGEVEELLRHALRLLAAAR
jgi:Holliday junction DNA helicase RuvA